MAKTPTLEDVATRAGVSTATVSRCLNQPDVVVEETRARVMEAVEALGYAPNFSARALVAKRTQTIGAVIPTMENAIFAEGIQAFQDVLQAERYMLLVASSGYDPAAEAEAVRTLIARGADGILLIGLDRDPAVYDLLATQSVPAVVAWAFASGGPVPSVGFDNAASMRALVAQGVRLGHKRVAMISGRTEGNDRARARVEGATAALRAAGLPDLVVEEADYATGAAADALDRLLDRVPDVTLVVCGNDVLAAGAMQRAHALGLSVPGQLSVTGFDDLGLARLVQPALTTVRVPHKTMGEAAARALLAAVDGQATESLLLPTELCLRDSLAAPKS